MMNAITLLKNQHRKVEALFKKLENGRSDAQTVLDELANSLAAHMAIEQEIFYPAVKEVDSDVVNESFEEHSLAEVALKRLLATDPEDEAFDARVTALKELIEHHVEEEEEELFPKVEKALEEEVLTQLAKEMKPRFEEVFEAGFEAAVPKGMAKTSADVSRKKPARKAKSAA
ncbi:MAG TPA: hemerythrin domain-containing protein [Polyangiaceae bacterium]|nr:hemerythrin domain-containing protein [Polyangiaceae bacterium]